MNDRKFKYAQRCGNMERRMAIDILTKEDVLRICTAEQMRKDVLEALKAAEKKSTPVFYMSFTKPASYVLQQLEKDKVKSGHVLIIDCSGNKEGKEFVNVVKIEDAKALEEMSIAASAFVDSPEKHKLFIIDAINVLAQYNRIEDVSKMLRNIIQKDDEEQTKMLVFCTDAKSEKLIAQVEPFFDNVVR